MPAIQLTALLLPYCGTRSSHLLIRVHLCSSVANLARPSAAFASLDGGVADNIRHPGGHFADLALPTAVLTTNCPLSLCSRTSSVI